MPELRAAPDGDRAVNPPITADARELYLNLLKQCLTRYLVIGEKAGDRSPARGWRRVPGVGNAVFALRRRLLRRSREEERELRRTGRDWPRYAETMIGLERLDHLQDAVTTVIREQVPGDLIETGVWRGGASIFMRAVLAAFDDTERRVWLADSFAGLPKPDADAHPADENFGDLSTFRQLAVSRKEVEANFDKYGLLDTRVGFLEGWFKDTLPDAPIDQLAVIRLDGDYYGSTMDALDALYPKLTVGGYLLVDDYGLAPCRAAVHDFRSRMGIDEPIERIDWTGIYWRRRR